MMDDDDRIQQVLFEHTKLNPNQADDRVLIDAAVRAVRELVAPAERYAAYLEADPCTLTSPEYEAFVKAFGPTP